MVLVKCNCMHACYWCIVVCYDKLSIQQCLCNENATKLNLKGGFCRNPRNPSGSATALESSAMLKSLLSALQHSESSQTIYYRDANNLKITISFS